MSFDSVFTPDAIGGGNATEPLFDQIAPIAPGFAEFIQHHSGVSFNQGVYRIHRVDEIRKWTEFAVAAFPKYNGRILCFASDWQGRSFALDVHRIENDLCQILLIEPGSGEAFQIPLDFKTFHDDELVNCPNDSLCTEFYRSWRDSGGAIPERHQCIGYDTPLFLGGQDAIDNMEVTDMEVYWSICGQLLEKTRDLPDGTSIGKVDFQ